MGTRINKNSSPLAKNDTFTATTDLTLTDAGAGLTDIALTHDVFKNGDHFQKTVCEWFGLDASGVALIQNAAATGGVKPGTVKAPHLHATIQEWKKLTKALDHLNVEGEKHAVQHGFL